MPVRCFRVFLVSAVVTADVAVAEPPPSPLDGAVSGIVVRVNGEAVTDFDLEPWLPEAHRDRAGWREPATAELVQAVLRARVENLVVAQAAREAGIRVTEADVDAAVAFEREQAGVDAAAFRAMVEGGGTPWERHLAEVRERLLVGTLYRRKARGASLYVTPADLKREYRADPDRFVDAEAVSYQVVVVPAGADEGSKEIADAVRRQLALGADAGAVARAYAAGDAEAAGEVCDMIPRGRLPAEVEKSVFALRPGEVSPVLPREGGGWEVYRVVSRRERRRRSFEDAEAQRSLREEGAYQRYEDRRRAVVDELMRKAVIEPAGLFGADRGGAGGAPRPQ